MTLLSIKDGYEALAYKERAGIPGRRTPSGRKAGLANVDAKRRLRSEGLHSVAACFARAT